MVLLETGAKSQNDNFLIWPKDLNMISINILELFLGVVYVLFPDPWLNRRYMKKRL